MVTHMSLIMGKCRGPSDLPIPENASGLMEEDIPVKVGSLTLDRQRSSYTRTRKERADSVSGQIWLLTPRNVDCYPNLLLKRAL